VNRRLVSTISPLLAVLAVGLSGGCRREAAVSRPPADGVYRLPLSDNPVSLDPARFTDVNSEGVARRIFNTLVKLGPDLQPVPDLAERVEVSADGRTYTFRLRRGVRFHNGREMTARDVRYSFERLLRPETMSHRAWVLAPVAGADRLRQGKASSLGGLETPDPYTVRLRLARPFGPFLSQLAMANAAIVPREEVEREGLPFGRRPVGTGPFRFVRWSDNHVVELEANPDYFLGPPKLSGLRFRIIKEPLVAYEEYRAGQLEHCAVPEGYLETVRRGPLAGELHSVATLSTYYLGFMMDRSPCGDNLHLRRALNYAVDRAFLCQKVLGGSHVPARGVLPPGLPGYNPDLEGYSYDPERARRELREAGYGPERPVPELTLFFPSSPPGPQVAQAVQSDFRRIGVRLRLRSLDLGALFEAVDRSEPDLFRLSWIADFPDPDNFLFIFHSRMHGSAGNRARYSNPEVDALLDRARAEPDRGRRLALLQEVEERVVHDAPWVFLSHKQTQLLVKPYVRGLRLGPMDVGTSVNQVDFHRVSFAAPEEF